MELVARGFTQEVSLGAVADFQVDELGGSVMRREGKAATLTPNPSDTPPNGARPKSPAIDHRHASIARKKGVKEKEKGAKKGAANDPRVRLIQNQCLKTSLNLFNRPHPRTRSLGFTSAIPGEGKTFLASITAIAHAERSHRPVMLLDCNWDNPALRERFGLPDSPGLAEWLRRECDLADIRHTITPYLTVISSGDAAGDTLVLTERFRAIGAQAILTKPDELLIADLPAVLTTDYGALLPQLLDAVLLVVHAGVTQESYIAEASRELADAPIEGTVLNATHSAIPRWLLRLL